jgi:hypothetical protein
MPQNPTNLLEEILCDADIAHLASTDFLKVTERVRFEIEHYMGRKLTQVERLTLNIHFVAGHRYFTEYARARYELQRSHNLAALREQVHRLKQQRNPKATGLMP